MALQSPLLRSQAQGVSVCGKLLLPGQSLVVPSDAVGPAESSLMASGSLLSYAIEGGRVRLVVKR